jgi:hypothetical protein
MRVEGVTKTATLTDDSVVLAFRGYRRSFGDPKTILLADIRGTHFSAATQRSGGFLQFLVAGDHVPVSNFHTAATHPLTIVFHISQEPAFRQLNETVEAKRRSHQSAPIEPKELHGSDGVLDLVPCPSCRRRLSPKARTCPGCGHPLEEGWATAENMAATLDEVSRHIEGAFAVSQASSSQVGLNHVPRTFKETHAISPARGTAVQGTKAGGRAFLILLLLAVAITILCVVSYDDDKPLSEIACGPFKNDKPRYDDCVIRYLARGIERRSQDKLLTGAP